MAGFNDMGCSDQFCTAEYWKHKYKACRAAMMGLSNIHRRKEKEIAKIRQRVIQICYDAQTQIDDEFVKAHFDKIRELLNQDCLMD